MSFESLQGAKLTFNCKAPGIASFSMPCNFLQVTHDISHLSCADVFRAAGVQTPVIVRFSTVIHERGSPETLRDPRGFAVKFYTRQVVVAAPQEARDKGSQTEFRDLSFFLVNFVTKEGVPGLHS